jgi:hypothetical protein
LHGRSHVRVARSDLDHVADIERLVEAETPGRSEVVVAAV